jgi:predicted helicase
MACGTGKTFTSLRIAENETNGKGMIFLFFSSLHFFTQTLRDGPLLQKNLSTQFVFVLS